MTSENLDVALYVYPHQARCVSQVRGWDVMSPRAAWLKMHPMERTLSCLKVLMEMWPYFFDLGTHY